MLVCSFGLVPAPLVLVPGSIMWDIFERFFYLFRRVVQGRLMNRVGRMPRGGRRRSMRMLRRGWSRM